MSSVEQGLKSPANQDRKRLPALAAALVVAVSLGGCAQMKRDHIVVGSVPQDYRTTHPITIDEREITLDLPAAVDGGLLTSGEKATIAGYIDGYDGSTGSIVRVMVPSGSANEAAAMRKSNAIIAALQAAGVGASAITLDRYGVASAEAVAPIRLSYTALRAGTDACGRWPDDLSQNTENKNYENFGCSYQKNLAAQIANPTDLLRPRKRAPIDAEKRGTAIDDWQAETTLWENTIFY